VENEIKLNTLMRYKQLALENVSTRVAEREVHETLITFHTHIHLVMKVVLSPHHDPFLHHSLS
jgi:hypothetical protein